MEPHVVPPADPTLDPAMDDPAQAAAERARDVLWREDFASQGLGMKLGPVAPGRAEVTMRVRRDMLNGFGICHGGLLTTLGDTAMAFASNSHNARAVAVSLGVDFIASARLDDVLTANAREVSRTRRTAVYDVTLTRADGSVIAVMRGRVQRMPDVPVVGG